MFSNQCTPKKILNLCYLSTSYGYPPPISIAISVFLVFLVLSEIPCLVEILDFSKKNRASQENLDYARLVKS
ncbi:hypothetical protein [Gardnerella vaginalis]|uniref:hypothetical protein n=1 Tax=Gardnerella vaginalis TaxID=2702 RepID=UPI0039EFFF7F